MIIRGMRIGRFGRFKSFEICDLPDGLTLILGPNEAGKSTLHAFLRGVLFGYPPTKPAERRLTHSGEPAGSLELERAGARYIVERKNAPKQPVVVRCEDGSSGDERMLRELLGNADASLFRAVFAFSLRELQDLGSLNAEQVRDRMFSATFGAGRLTPAAACTALEDRAKVLFKEKGSARSSSQLAQLLEQIAEVDSRIATARRLVADFPALDMQIEQLAAEIESAQGQERAMLSERALCDALASLASPRDELTAITTALAAMPRHDRFPEDAERRYNDIRSALTREEEALAELQEEQVIAGAALTAIQVDEALVSLSAETSAVMEDLALQRDRLRRIDKAYEDAQFARQALKTQLEKLDDVWTEDELASWSRSLSRRQQCQEWEVRLAQAATAAGESIKAVAVEESTLKSTSEALARLRDQLPAEPLRLEELHRQESLVNRVRGAREAERERQQELRDADARVLEVLRSSGVPSEPARAVVIVTVVILIVVALLAYMGMKVPAMLASVGAALLLLLAMRKRPTASASATLTSAQAQRASCQAALDAARAELGHAVSVLGKGSHPSVEELAAALTSITRQVQARTHYEFLLQQLQAAESNQKRASENLDVARSAAERAAAFLECERQGWQRFRETMGIVAVATPRDTLAIIEVLDAARDQLDRVALLLSAIKRDEEASKEWTAQALRLLSSAPIALETKREVKGNTILGAVASLSERVNTESEKRRSRDASLQACKSAEARLFIGQTRRQNSVEVLQALLQDCDCEAENEFLTRAREVAKRRELEEKRLVAERELNAGLRTLGDESLARERLAIGTVSEWIAREEEIEREIEQCERTRETAIMKRSALLSEREKLSQATDIATLDLSRATLVAKAREMVQEWLELSIAGRMIKETREIYERERQPAVISYATPLFSAVTAGRYDRILQHEDGSGFDILTADGERWRESDLSQGTQEQLYLCLRFALAEEFSKDRSMLPILMDDVLVNFDPQRAAAVSAVISEVARKRQVLLFTCHPGTEELLRGHSPGMRSVHVTP